MSTESKNSSQVNSNNSTSESQSSRQNSTDWKIKLNDIVQTCQSELKKTTKIGMKMLSASQSNVQLHEAYEELGKWLVAEVQAGKISLGETDQEVKELVEKVQTLEEQLELFEQDVQDIKKE